MPINYERCEDVRPEILQMAYEVMEKYHSDLKCPDGGFVRLCILLAFRGDDSDEPAVTANGGWPCYAKISIIPLKQRVDKRADAEIIIDKNKWDNELTEPMQRALLDHEIQHLEIRRDDLGAVVTDDIGRPKLAMRPHDYELTGFAAVARRHGQNAIEVIDAGKFAKAYGADILPAPAAVKEASLYPQAV